MKVERVKYVIWAVDPRRALQFYRDVLGLRLVHEETNEEQGVREAMMAVGDTGSCVQLLAPLTPCLFLLPLLGVMLNGTSSVLYGTVPDLTPPHRTERAFALFYTGTIGSGAVAPIIYGVLGDAIGTVGATISTAVTALLILPLAIALAPHLLNAGSES